MSTDDFDEEEFLEEELPEEREFSDEYEQAQLEAMLEEEYRSPERGIVPPSMRTAEYVSPPRRAPSPARPSARPSVKPSARPKRPMTEDERLQFEEYQRRYFPAGYEKEWLRTYGIDPTLRDPALARREAEIRRAGGVEAIRAEREKALTKRIAAKPKPAPEKKAAGIVRKYITEKCENISEIQKNKVDPVLTIKLRVKDVRGAEHIVCYDVIALMAHLQNSAADETRWREPVHQALLSPAQRDAIKRRYAQINSCSKGSPVYNQVIVYPSDDDMARIPLSIYDRATHMENKYLIFRVLNPVNNLYKYVVASGFVPTEFSETNDMQISADDMVALDLSTGSPAFLEDCFDLKMISYLQLKPREEEWYDLPDEAVEDIKRALVSKLEQAYVVQLGQDIPITYKNKTYYLTINDLKVGTVMKDVAHTGRRVAAAITRNVDEMEVALDILPQKGRGSVGPRETVRETALPAERPRETASSSRRSVSLTEAEMRAATSHIPTGLPPTARAAAVSEAIKKAMAEKEKAMR